MSRRVLFVLGSPSETSRSTLVARRLAGELASRDLVTHFVSLRDFDAEDVFLARTNAPAIARFVEDVKTASAIVLATPVYKASYSGALKAIIDLVPPDALSGKPALGIATTRLAAHGPLADRAFDALFAFFGAPRAETLVVLDAEITTTNDGAVIDADATARIARAAASLHHALSAEPARP